MTKKDYELFANEIHKLVNESNLNDNGASLLVAVCSRVFKKDNPAFQEAKFNRACYEGKHIRKSIAQNA